MSQTVQSLKHLLKAWRNMVYGTNLPQPPEYDGPDVLINRLTEKTSEVEPGSCFVARVRETSDGHPYIGKAIDLGASMILAQHSPDSLDLEIADDVAYLQVPDTALALAWLAAAWYGFPSRSLVVIGVTGTDGKTSTGNILYSILRANQYKVGLLSTIKAIIGDQEEPLALHVTTPETQEVQHFLRRMVDAGLTHCIVEATSHGLAQNRVGAIDFDLAVVTNITHEHLDYHGSYERYFAAKARLFEGLTLDNWQLESENLFKQQVAKTAVLNRDDASYDQLSAIPVPKRLTYSLLEDADVQAYDIAYSVKETRFQLRFDADARPPAGGSIMVSSMLAGEFNVYNMLAAGTTALGLGVLIEAVQEGLEAVQQISGRMERINRGQPFQVIVDFAHTPNALENVIEAARRMTDGRVITVFGSAGKRDVEKRRFMAAVSARTADLTVLTAEDPRTESLDDILAMMADGCREQGGQERETFWRVSDRGRAIYFALGLAQPNDVVLICGKGHEQSMCFGTTEYPWDDREATKRALDAVLHNRSMSDLGLPTYGSS
jgi:UDP-N-acetylmuramoyl-L-alanyl-D-glutamate--2,6-diaminopimelate ligase